MIVIFFIVIAAVNALNFHAVLESVDAECPKQCPECEWATLLLDGVHKLHATIDKVSKFLFYYNNITFKRFLFLFWFVIFIIGSFFFLVGDTRSGVEKKEPRQAKPDAWGH